MQPQLWRLQCPTISSPQPQPAPVTRAIDPPVIAPTPAAPNADAIRAEALRAAADILTLCQRHGLDNTFAADLIGRGLSLDAARGAVLDKLGRGLIPSAPAPVRRCPAAARDTGASEIAYRDAVTDALLHRHSPGLHKLTDASARVSRAEPPGHGPPRP